MDFNLNFIQSQLQESARRMFEGQLSPQQIRDGEESEHGFPISVWEEGTRLGWPGISLSEAFGGGGCGLLDMCVLAEEIGRGGATLPFVSSSGVAATLLENSPEGEHRDRLLSNIAAGEVIAPALIDAEGRTEWDSVRLPITERDGEYRLSGKKILVPFASKAAKLLVTAMLPDGELAIIAIDSDSPGVSISRHHTMIGVPLFSVEFDNVQITDTDIVHRGQGADVALRSGLQVGSLLATAEAIGLSEALKDMATEYVSVREAFGQPIGAFQAVAHPCADMHIDTVIIRLLVQEAAWMIDSGQDASEEISSTKALANEEFARLANDAFRVHGAIGYSKEYDLQLFFRRLRGFCQTLGETQASIERAATVVGL